MAPALAARNTLVLKPAGLTPLTAVEFERIAREAGIPEGVVNVVVGPGSEVGRRLVENPDVAKVAFTGSTEVGKRIAEGAAGTIKRVAELGGKSANVVFADADLEKAASEAPAAVFGNAGQDCCARSRILVERKVFDDFLSLMQPAVEGFRVGDPFDEGTDMGPLISADHRETVSSYVPEDAPVAIKGSAPQGAGSGIRRRCSRRSRTTTRRREEIFGPVVAVIPFDDEEDAVRQANDTIYGLSRLDLDGERRPRPARREAHGDWRHLRRLQHLRPGRDAFGGMKQSGVGRELGPHALDYYTEIKNVYISTEEA